MAHDFSDYGRRVEDAIDVLARVENRAAEELLLQLLLQPSDLLRFRHQDSNSDSGSIPLDVGLKLLEGARRALLSVACSVAEPAAVHPKLSGKQVDAFAGECLLGQTDWGSFIATVACPVAASPSTPGGRQEFLLGMTPEPFARAVTKTFMRSVSSLATHALPPTLQEGQVVEKLVQQGISLNLCNALMQIQPSSSDGTITVECAWSRGLPVPKDVTASVRLASAQFMNIRHCANLLAASREESEVEIIGRVDLLRGELGNQKLMEGEIVIAYVTEQRKLRRAVVALLPDDYSSACDAHKLAKHVRLLGKVIPGKRLGRIDSYSGFRVLS
ncbi:MAG: hypothetical protein HUU15_02405 [Candidatus Brocadiae bacterium]|nr:hypothetical protein [Candidatus Brocadiia bacterium]